MGLESLRTISLKKGVSGKARLTPFLAKSFGRTSLHASRAVAKAVAIPLFPLAKVATPAKVARKAWLEQTFEVALSFRICCSLVDKTMTRHSLPFTSMAFPTKRPGVERTSR